MYELSVLMHKFKIKVLPINFRPYFTNTNKIHHHSTIFQKVFNKDLLVCMTSSPILIWDLKYGKKYPII